MNVLGEGFDPKILGQIDARQKLAASGYLNNNPRTPEFITYANSTTSYLRLMSSTFIENIQTLNSPYIKSLNLTGNTLAKEAILFGGVQSYQGPLKGGVLNTDLTNPLNNFAYGWGGTQFGLRPMPGIISANIKTENIGSLKTSTINIKAYTQAQFEIIDALYLRLGFYVLLEWGHTRHINNNGEPVKEVPSLQNEFFSDGASVNGLLELIIQKRYSSFGNYDAILGKVVNFDWTFEKDGTYNITVIIRSIGDVIETIKANVFTEPKEISNVPLLQQVNTNPAYQQQQALQQSRQFAPSFVTDRLKSNIHYRLYSLQDYLDKQTTPSNSEFSVSTYLSDSKLQDIARVSWDGVKKITTYYVRFGALLRLIAEEVIPTVYKGNDKYKLINIDYDADTNVINYLDAQLSADPRNILIKKSFKEAQVRSEILPSCEPYEFPIDKIGTYGNLMNVYISYDYLFGLLDSNKIIGDSKVSLISFLQQIGQTINGALGGINSIVPVIDEDTNTVRFIDQNILYKKEEVINYFNGNIKYTPTKKIPTQKGVFDLFGYNPSGSAGSGSAGFIKEFTLKTELTPQFASMITIAAAARSKVVGEDATALSRLNKGLKTSLFEEINDANILPDDNNVSSKDEQYKDAVKGYIDFVKAMDMSSQKQPSWVEADVDTYPSVLNSFIRYTQQLASENNNAASTSTGFIPINMSLTMTGLSGMKIYQELTVNTSYLPTNYSKEMTFIIKGINHTIQNNVWSTTVETLSLPKITTKPDLVQTTVKQVLNTGTNTSETMANVYIPTLDSALPNIEYGVRLLMIAQTQFEGFFPGTLSYRTNNPGNIGNVDAGGKRFFPTLEAGIKAQYKHIIAVINGRERNYPLGKVVSQPNQQFQNRSTTYPGFSFTYIGQLDQYLKIYSTGARLNNSYVNFIVGYFKKQGGIIITPQTTLYDIYQIKSKPKAGEKSTISGISFITTGTFYTSPDRNKESIGDVNKKLAGIK